MALVVRSEVGNLIKQHEFRMSAELCDALDKKVEELIKQAIDRARNNSRSTVMPQDL